MIWACLLSTEGVDCLHLLLPELLHLQALFTIGQGLHPDFVKSASLFFGAMLLQSLQSTTQQHNQAAIKITMRLDFQAWLEIRICNFFKFSCLKLWYR